MQQKLFSTKWKLLSVFNLDYTFFKFYFKFYLKFKSDIYLLLIAIIIWIYFISFYVIKILKNQGGEQHNRWNSGISLYQKVNDKFY